MARLKIDVMLSDSVVEAAEQAVALERAGVDGVFSFENAHDLFFPLVAAAPVCSLDLMTNVAIAFPRSPMHLANAAYDLHLLSKGRFRLGLGTQVRAHVEKRFGARWGNAVEHMREWVLALTAILRSWQDGTRLDFRGEYTTHTLMTPIFDPGPNPYGVPKVLVGALGPKMNEMVAEVADGVLVMPFNTDRHMRERTMPAIERGLAAARRAPRDEDGPGSAGLDGGTRREPRPGLRAPGVAGLDVFDVEPGGSDEGRGVAGEVAPVGEPFLRRLQAPLPGGDRRLRRQSVFEEVEAPAGPQHTSDLGQRLLDTGDRAEGEGRQGAVAAAVVEG